MAVSSTRLLAVLRCLRLLQECPPTVRQIIEAGDRAIDAAGLNPWAMNEGLATGDERHVPWMLEDCIQDIATAISSANAQGGLMNTAPTTPTITQDSDAVVIESTNLLDAPVRLCCGQRHFGPVCPDGLVMCCLCFERVSQNKLNVAPDGRKEDVCKQCAEQESASNAAASCSRLFLIRGVPGSGKTTYAETLELPDHYEADMWFEDNGGYDPSKIKLAHEWCQKQAIAAMQAGRDVVVSNTFTRLWEMQPYKDAARSLGIAVIEKVMTGEWRNVHGVPDDKVRQMRERFEYANSV